MWVNSIADTGAQVNLGSVVDSVKSGYRERDLVKVTQRISATSSQPMESVGARLSVVKVNSCEANVVAFVSRGIQDLQLSRLTLKSMPAAADAETRAGEDGTAERSGVIEKWPNGAPTSGLHRMVRVPIPNKIPWRIVSLAPSDKSCKRETQVTVLSPRQAWIVPTYPGRILTDTGSGHRDALVWEEGKNFVTNSDDHSERHNRIVESDGHETKVAEGVIMWATDRGSEAHGRRAGAHLTPGGKYGAVQNGGSIQVCKTVGNVAGSKASEQEEKPMYRYAESSASSLARGNVSAAWCNLVSQTEHRMQPRDRLTPDIPRLSSKP